MLLADVQWFVATDVARILGYRDAANLCRRLDSDERGTRSVSTPGGEQDVTVITEAGRHILTSGRVTHITLLDAADCISRTHRATGNLGDSAERSSLSAGRVTVPH